MKVKCIKDTIGFKKGEIYETVWNFIKSDVDNHVFWSKFPEYFQEKPSQALPRWKVGDYVVTQSYDSPPDYIKIYSVWLDMEWKKWYYNDIWWDDLRDPTDEELKIYFR